MKKLSLALLLPLLLTACAFNDDPNNDPTRRRQLEDRNKLVNDYSSIQGVYEGTFQKPSGTERLKMSVAYRERVVGRTNEGELLYQPVLIVKWELPDSTRDDNSLEGTFYKENGDLTLTTRGVGADNICVGDDCLYIRGTLRDGNFTAPVKSLQGVIQGTMNVQRTSAELDMPKDGDTLDEYEEYRAKLQKFAGRYLGKAKGRGRDSKDFEIDMTLQIVDGARTEKPKLVSSSFLTNGFSRVALHSVRYINDRGLEEMIFEPGPGAIGFDAFTMTATWSKTGLKGMIQIPKNGTRVFEAKRVD